MEDAKSYTERYNARAHRQGAVRPCAGADRDRREARRRAGRDRRRRGALDQAAGPRSRAEDYTDFYRSVAGQFDEPALTVHFRAEGRHEYTALALRAGLAAVRPVRSRPQGPHQALRQARLHHRRGRDPAALSALRARAGRFRRPAAQRLARDDPGEPDPGRDQEGRDQPRARRAREARREATPRPTPRSGRRSAPVLKEGLYEDFERRDALLALARFKTTASDDRLRSLKDYVGALKENQTAIYYLAGDDLARLEASPHLEGFRARGIEVLLLTDPVDSFWVTSAPSFDGKPFKSVTQGAADLALIPRARRQGRSRRRKPTPRSTDFIAFIKTTLGDAVSDVRASDRLTDSAVCLVASGARPRPAAREAAGRRRPAQDRRQADPRDQPAPRPRRGAGGARRRRPRVQGGRRASAVRRGARARRRASRTIRAPSPSGSPASWAAASRRRSRGDAAIVFDSRAHWCFDLPPLPRWRCAPSPRAAVGRGRGWGAFVRGTPPPRPPSLCFGGRPSPPLRGGG